MSDPDSPGERVLHALKERVKELNCIYEADKVLNQPDGELDALLAQVLTLIPPAFQYPEVCEARIVHRQSTFTTPHFVETPWLLQVNIVVQGEVVGTLGVYYIREMPPSDVGPFLNEEVRLIDALSERLGNRVQFQRLRDMFEGNQGAEQSAPDTRQSEWRVVLRMLRRTDQHLYARMMRRLINYLCWSGTEAAQQAVLRSGRPTPATDSAVDGLSNFPAERRVLDERFYLTDEPIHLAAAHLSDDEIMTRVERWIFEDRAGSLLKVLGSDRSLLGEVAEALRRFHHLVPRYADLSRSTLSSLKVSLIRRFLTDQLEFITVAKEYIEVPDFLEIIDQLVLPAGSQGKLGGKSAGLFLAAKVISKAGEAPGERLTWRIPKSWYVASDGLIDFIRFNDLEEAFEQNYKDIGEVRLEYPRLVQLFKNGRFSQEMLTGLAMALDQFRDHPLIVRSSSRLEDRFGTAFSGKYKSLFLANQGTKQERLDALCDAIAEVYASTLGPDPIEYRRARGLIDFDEGMGILIQEVVGARAGKYFLPAFSGVAFSHNELRWSPRIKREDGLLRLVPGLGTRAVDRVADDYPVLIAPGQPQLRTNVSLDEVVRYSPRRVDVINLESRTFETIDLSALLAEVGTDYPGFKLLFSMLGEDHLRAPVGPLVDPTKDPLVATFEGLRTQTPFVSQVHKLLQMLQKSLGTPVDVEFACDGKDVYLLQCRPQSNSEDNLPEPIPKDVPKDQVIFSANRHVSNGAVPDITHVVYVDLERYAMLETQPELVAVGRAVSRLNQVLPKRQFILIGPGRWGSRGDIRLGVSVTYSDISNTAVLIEVARKKGNYVPELSFGTHFFQDLVESSIRYLPLYPDDPGIAFNERFLTGATNMLPSLVPELATLGDTVRVVDVPEAAGGMVLRVALNADLDEALGYLVTPSARGERRVEQEPSVRRSTEDYWRWRMQMAERIAASLDAARFGVQGFFVFGSTKNATAGPSSDIDLLVHFRGTPEQSFALQHWLEGWSWSLGEMNYLRTGYRSGRLLDVHLVTDEDIAQRTSYAIKIGAATDAAMQLPTGGALGS